MQVLVVGGAGYIGSHMVRRLQASAYTPVVLDNFSTGHRDAIGNAELIEGDLGDAAWVENLFVARKFAAVMHFAAFSLVGESVQQPEKYFRNNVEATRTLLEAMLRHKQDYFIFSSSAAVYGEPSCHPEQREGSHVIQGDSSASPQNDNYLITESYPLQPINPYGETKKQVEEMLVGYAASHGLHYGSLRYFNAAGADPSGELGERHEPETHLIPLVLQAASGRRDAISIYGQDYPTPDGTCIRDYIHVNDLAEAHLQLLDYMKSGGAERVFNLGTGQGYSVRQVVDTARDITGKSFTVKQEPRRAGDPAVLVADGSKARKLLGWQPQRSAIHTIIEDAWRWECGQAKG